ncbi:hypothetical protein PHLCEN_2v7170 [Hermanssonia centrifuga]|uniref:Uncharacterized protein n=1 Tax=Hermanssonia centrifuga TaxID=98765 RepID=A0A2R6NX56_9APHY|nr:hypothetical protein PHLCEN_2v7170 [Hermanssonia centrifuga]
MPESVREQGIMVNPDSPSIDGDWLFYLSSVHKSQSLRARRRLWAIGEEIFRAVAEHRVGSEYDYVVSPDGQEQVPKSKTKKALEDSLADPVAVQLREMILSDRNNFRL